MNDKKIILTKGGGLLPARFWSWGICTEYECNKKGFLEKGWVKSECTKYLTEEQLNYLTN